MKTIWPTRGLASPYQDQLMDLSVRIVNIDYYLSDLGPFDRSSTPFSNAPLKKVPVIRIFGSTPVGQKTCVHVHQVYPYFFVPFDLTSDNPTAIQQEIYRFGTALNHVMNLSQSKTKETTEQYIAAIVLVKGIPFYGYHTRYQTFLKIYLLNPSHKLRMLELLQSGAVLEAVFQPYEAHIPYELQFLMDYNLYGMNWIQFSAVDAPDTSDLWLSLRFRQPLLNEPKASFLNPTFVSPTSSMNHPVFTARSVPEHLQWRQLQRTSYCELELDVTAMAIANRLQVKERDIHSGLKNDKESVSTKSSAPKENIDKFVKSLAGIWEDETNRRRFRGVQSPIPPVSQVEERLEHTPWSNETDLWRMIDAMIKEDDQNQEVADDSFPKVLTAFQAVEALYPARYYEWMNARGQMTAISSEHSSHPQVSLITPPTDLGLDEENLHALFDKSTGSGSPGEQETPMQESEAPTSTFAEQLLKKGANVNRGAIENILQADSFHGGSLDTDALLEMVEEAEQDEQYDKAQEEDLIDNDEDHDEIVEWIERMKEEKVGPSQVSRRVEIEYEDVIGDKNVGDNNGSSHNEKPWPSRMMTDSLTGSDQLTISDVPPSSSANRRKRKSRHIPQVDGADDEEDIPDDTNLNAEEAWASMRRSYRREKQRRYTRVSQEDSLKYRPTSLSSVEEAWPESSKQDRNKTTSHVQTTRERDDEDDLPTVAVSPFDEAASSPNDTNVHREDRRSVDGRSSGQVMMSNGHPSYFIERLNGMWSPRQDQEEIRYPAFWFDPPKPFSPHQAETESAVCEQSSQTSELSNPFLDVEDDLMMNHEAFPSSSLLQMSTYHKPDTKASREYIYKPAPPAVDPPTTVSYQSPYYSNPDDVPSRPKVFAGKEFKLLSHSVIHLKEFDPSPVTDITFVDLRATHWWRVSRIRNWMPAKDPPALRSVTRWLEEKEKEKEEEQKVPAVENSSNSQLDRPTAKMSYDFKFSISKPKAKVTKIRDYIDLFSLEIHVNTRANFLPDFDRDPVQMAFWCLQTEDDSIVSNGFQQGYHIGIIAVSGMDPHSLGFHNVDVELVDSEKDLLHALIDRVRLYDPDLLVGYELHSASWGYLIERAATYDINLIDELSRVYTTSQNIQRDRWGYQKASVFRVIGRHMINVWRLMKSEVNLKSYTYENVVYNLLHYRVPHFSHQILTAWYQHGAAVVKHRLVRYYLERVQINLDLLDISEVISRTAESARVFGIDFYSVITRGSQFKVESTMLRIAKPENYMLISPSRKQVAEQRAIECLPLIMEPLSKFYASPLVVLDFQSLYPSIMIAYNYCYSTCLGRVRRSGDSRKFGVSDLMISPKLLEELKEQINVAPNGVMYVKESIRKSLLAKMLTELLDTRVMVKRSMKDYKEDRGLLRLLNARQLTLKYLANVTYGYTSATFSGRMPAVDIADSIVQTGREMLEKTIELVNSTERWGAKVVYGDTDSVFVYFPGKTRDDAFTIGNEIAQTITKMFPAPIKLKFEKVYHPSVLVAKKRYVGFKYESPEDKEPAFEAKGIETVRRDGVVATQKIQESSLKILFRTQDMCELKQYLYREWTKILSNRVSLQDFIIAKEVRLGTYRSIPHGAKVAQDNMAMDPRAEPQYGERVPYVVVYRGANATLKEKVVRPEAVLLDNSLRLDAEYYIRKQIIPPLERIFNLVGVDIMAWYDSMPRSQKAAALALSYYDEVQDKGVNRIDRYYASSHCIICRQLSDQPICDKCKHQKSLSLLTLISRQRETQEKLGAVLEVCDNCSQISPLLTASTNPHAAIGRSGYADHPCDSLDCPVFYERIKAKNDVRATSTYDTLLEQLSD